ncbi:MAG: hypothetical protein CVT63_04910 [Candidatus Anoxymicrobium japonicum]|uniref:Prephenate dehydrogenase n=1 Tax=Candidatus Anoxymicrobium japonicum TaxID=2013648 RepID=A0A2N3G601_9ACTN|nr:MAG: hypothetical protein CVT63_04910 [Candidatus Anoxymicrobium japonicum]
MANFVFEKIAILGTGLMGGSLAMALKACEVVGEVVAYDISNDARNAARELGVADRVEDRSEDAVRGSGAIFLATPIGAMAGALKAAAPALMKGAVISDLASVKIGVISAIEAVLPAGAHYVGGHPMTGSERSGVSNARADLFRDRCYVLTPTDTTDLDSYQKLHTVLTEIGARVISMDPESHDRAMATISHVPHLLSLLMMNMAAREKEQMNNIYTLAAGGFRDMTRVAASNPRMWLDIVSVNRDFIIEELKRFASSVDVLVDILQKNDRDAVLALFVDACAAREELSMKPGVEKAELFTISLPVPDELGVISKIATAVGALGINIEDIGIAHPLEGAMGILTLKVLGAERAREVTLKLESMGYNVSSEQ